MNPTETREGVDYVLAELTRMNDEADGREFDEADQARYDEGVAYVEDAAARIKRHNDLADLAARGSVDVRPVNTPQPAVRDNVNVVTSQAPDLDDALRADASPAEVRDSALRTLERAAKLYDVDPDGLAHAERLARQHTSNARHIATYGTDLYGQAWAKRMTGREFSLTPDEQRALVVGTTTSAGSMVPTHLDPTIILTNSGAYNPFRQFGRVVTLPSPGPNTWNGVTSAGMTFSEVAESSAIADGSPETAAPSIPTFSAKGHAKASYEAMEDVAGLSASVASMFADARNNYEAARFATGNGSSQPQGVITALDANTFVEVDNTTAATLGLVDLHAALNGLSARFRDRATWIMSPAILGTIQQLGATEGAGYSTDATQSYTSQILGRPVGLSSSFPGTPSSTTEVENWLAVGDFSNFVIVDKVGMSSIYYPVAVDGSGVPTGEAGWVAWFRQGSEVVYSGTATTNRAFVLLQDQTSA